MKEFDELFQKHSNNEGNQEQTDILNVLIVEKTDTSGVTLEENNTRSIPQ